MPVFETKLNVACDEFAAPVEPDAIYCEGVVEDTIKAGAESVPEPIVLICAGKTEAGVVADMLSTAPIDKTCNVV